MKKKIIVANWKMNGDFEFCDQWFLDFVKNLQNNKNLIEKVEAVLALPFVFIDNMTANIMEYCIEEAEKNLSKEQKNKEEFDEKLEEMILLKKPLSLAAQDCHYEEKGAFTGNVSAKMVVEVGCEYVILGHSERRQYNFETNEIVAKKAIAALNQDIVPIICVGENKEIRDEKKHLEFVYAQLLKSVPKEVKAKKIVIAYEPIWSIGTGNVPNNSQIQEMAALIRKICDEKFKDFAEEFFILYGGSVDVSNSKEILAINNVDGLLIGKTSLNCNDFFEICKNS